MGTLITLLKIRMFIARSWVLSWCLYRLHGVRLIGPPGEYIWYFAYGSNMHDSIFRGWRNMSPLEWRAGQLCGYRLRFNLDGWPRGKAALANLHAEPQAEVWGVLWRITRRDLVRLDASEGIPWWHYRPIWLDAEDVEGNTLRVVTYVAQGNRFDRSPSLRYITLMREGARTHSLPEHYLRFLERIEHAR